MGIQPDMIISAVMYDGKVFCDGPSLIMNGNDGNIGYIGDQWLAIEETLMQYRFVEWGILL